MRFVRVESLNFFILVSSTRPTLWYPLPPSPSGGMADAEVSKTFVARRVSSSLTSGTIPRLTQAGRPKGGRPAFVLARGHECAGATSLPKACSKGPLEISDLPQGHFRHDGQFNTALNAKRPNGFTRPTSLFAWWPVRDSNPRHEDFQSSALPTELTGRKCRDNYTSVYRVASRTILKRFQNVFNLCT